MEFLSECPSKSTMTEVAKALSYPKNSVFRIMSTLEAQGYLIRSLESNSFFISRKMLALGYKALIETNLMEVSLDVLRMMRDETRETALLGCLLEGEGVVLDQTLSPEPIKVSVSPGTRFTLHSAAPGKAILAYMEKKERERQLSLINFTRFTPQTITSPSEYREELKKIKEMGYATDCGEEAEGIICVSAPVFDYRGIPKAAIWVTAPEFRFSRKQIPAIGEIVKKYAEIISRRLGFIDENPVDDPRGVS